MHVDHQAEIVQRHLRERLVAQDAGVVDEDVDATPIGEDGIDLIEKGEIDQLKDAMKQGISLGMLTFDESLYRLYSAGRISIDEALNNADSRTDLALRIRLNQPASEDGGMRMEDMT